MNDFTTDAKMALTNKISLTEIVHQHVEDAVNQLLENELTVFWITKSGISWPRIRMIAGMAIMNAPSILSMVRFICACQEI